MSAAGSMEVVEHADAGGTHDEQVLRGDVHVVRERRERAAAHTRTRMAIQAELDKLVPSEISAAIPAEALQREREAVAARGGIVQKTAAKVSTDEHTWELFVHEQCVEIEAFPSEAQVVEFAIWMSMRRERACLAQRSEAGARLTGLVKRTVRNMLTELFMHAWPRRWPAYRELEKKERAAYEDSILKQVDGIHKQASASLAEAECTEGMRERAAQLREQTSPVTERKHFYRTEVHQVQDVLLAEEEDINGAIALGAALAIMQTTAARCGMLTKDNYDAQSVMWADKNPLRVRDVTYALLELSIGAEGGDVEATSHMQINWQRVKRAYFEVYLFRSAVTANSKQAVRRATVFITVLLIATGRFRVCRKGLSEAQVAQLKENVHAYGGLRLKDTAFHSWEELYGAAREDAFRCNADELDDPLIPRVVGGKFDLKASMLQREVYEMLCSVTLKLGYEPNASGVYSYRKYAISMACRALGYHKATRMAQHADVNQETVNGVYDADNANEDFGAGEMGRPQVEMEPTDSLAAQRVPAIAQFLTPSDVPIDSRAYREELLESEEWKRSEANVRAASKAVELAVAAATADDADDKGSAADMLSIAQAALKKARGTRSTLRSKILRRVLKRHRVYEWAAGLDKQRTEWSRSQLLGLLKTVEFESMSEQKAVAFHLERLNRATAREEAVAAEADRRRASRKRNKAAQPMVVSSEQGETLLRAGEDQRAVRLRARCARRGDYVSLAADAADGNGDPLELDALDMLEELDSLDALDELEAAASAVASAMSMNADVEGQIGAQTATEATCPGETLLVEYEAMQADPACQNAKKELASRSGIPERTLMRMIAAARKRRAAVVAA